MTTKQTAEASTDNKPGKGEVLIYIDFQGRKLFGKPTAQVETKPEVKPE
jgi:hypothetical protein